MSPPFSRPSRQGFSLVEVALAVGVVAFAFVGILALLPTGLNVFRSAMNTSVTSQISQRVINDAMQTDFDVLVDTPASGEHPESFTFVAPKVEGPEYRYFDDQGNELPKERRSDAIYHVLVRVTPGTRLARSGPQSETRQIATVTVQVAANPGNKELKPVGGDPADSGNVQRNLWPRNAGVPILTYSAHVARNTTILKATPRG
ncbi:MAG: Verru_Chthon cassette protein B [Verrucomicrobiota bacterium]|nr:Verru_Chthon cassette protein B [Verrucomicrobiota bacterium]